jgi:hypothetical protein
MIDNQENLPCCEFMSGRTSFNDERDRFVQPTIISATLRHGGLQQSTYPPTFANLNIKFHWTEDRLQY